MRHSAGKRTIKLSEDHRTRLSSAVKSGDDKRVLKAVKTVARDRARCALQDGKRFVFTEGGPGSFHSGCGDD